MRYRVNAALVIGRRRIFESLIHPGFYIAVSISMLLCCVFISSFVRSIDSSGFNYEIGPVYRYLGGALSGAFGSSILSRIFVDGPFLLAANVAFLPVLFYLSITSVHRFGSEKASGAIELLTYGPADGTSYFLASMLKDAVLTLVALAALLVLFIFAGAVDNLAVTPRLFGCFLILFLTATSIYAYGVFISSLTDGANSAIALFLGGFALFAVILLGSYSLVGGYVRSLSNVASWTIQWVSPFYYWSLGARSITGGGAGTLLVSVGCLIGLTAGLLLASHFVIRTRGVRP